MRAAQTCGLPYFFQNTTTLALNLKKLDPNSNETIEIGDLIWFKGHVMIISDIKNNKIIESVGYGSGWGKVHEIELNKIFYGIDTINDLLKYYQQQKTLKRINKYKEISLKIPKFIIFKLI